MTALAEPTPVVKKSSRMVQLEVLRGVAILLVIGAHPLAEPSEAGPLRWPAQIWLNMGWTGVDLFFVLSGFLVGGLLLKELRTLGRLDVGRFMARRAMKIWPAYYLLVGTALVVSVHKRGLADAWERYWPNVANVQNYFGTNPLGQTWSLAIEEHFYLALSLLPWGLSRFGRGRWGLRLLPVIAAGVMVACTAARCIIHAVTGHGFWMYQFPTHLRIDSLAAGVLLAYLYHFHPVGLAAAVLISPMTVLHLMTSPFIWTGYDLLYIGYGCILVAAIHCPVGAEGGMRWLAVMAVRTAGSCIAGILMARLIEFPGITPRDRLFPSRSGALRSNAA